MSARPPAADALFVALQLVECREQGPGLGAGQQPQHAAAATEGRLEAEDCLDTFPARPGYLARRGAAEVDFEAVRFRVRGMRREFGRQSLRAADSGDAPCERQHVAPM